MRHRIGIEDEQFIRGKIPMTKREIRILTLARAQIGEDDTVVDVGAGTGSLSVEAALLAQNGHVYAIEQKEEGAELIRQNAEKFGAANLTVCCGKAPEALNNMPAADVILIGGSGKAFGDIFRRADELLKVGGRLVINCVTAETLFSAIEGLKQKKNYTYDAAQIQVTRLQKVGKYHMSQALNPIHIVSCVKTAVELE